MPTATRMLMLAVLLPVSAECAERANICFTAHAKTSLQCTHALKDGEVCALPRPLTRHFVSLKALHFSSSLSHIPLSCTRNTQINVYDDSESPQKARKRFWSKGKLCDSKRCGKCMAVGGSWVSCGSVKAHAVPAKVMWANRDWSKASAVAVALAAVAIPVLVFTKLGKGKSPAQAATSTPATGIASSLVDYLLAFSSAPWFPLIAALGTAINMFTIIFTGATVVLFLAAILGQKRNWPYASVANAAGATLGTAALLYLVRERGDSYLNETFPTVLASPAWAKAMGWMQTYGVGGMLLVSSLPIILHPVVVFGLLSNMSDAKILSIVMAGRTIKYLTMGWVTANAPHALKYFGIKGSLVEYATKATEGR